MAIKAQLRSFQDEAEAKPDVFIRYEYPKLLDQSRQAVAEYLNAPVETCTCVPNATTGVVSLQRFSDGCESGSDGYEVL